MSLRVIAIDAGGAIP